MPPHRASTINNHDSVADSHQETSQDQGSEDHVEHRGRIRMNGESFAESRPISADLDSTDELIVKMKDAGYNNAKIAMKLRDEGRVSYDKKTVGSRYLRIKNAIADREEQRLDAELTDWHEGEVRYFVYALVPVYGV
jgi:hypothetical protein